MSTKTYPVGVALSIASGTLLCDFPDMHEAIEHLAGQPVFTHQLASEVLADDLAEAVIRQVPWMPGAIENMPDWSGLPRDAVRPAIERWLDDIRAQVGDEVTLDAGVLERRVPFTEGLPEKFGGEPR